MNGKIIGAAIRAKRKSSKITMKDLANLLDISIQQVSKYESGLNNITALNLWRISEFFGCDIGVFYRIDSDHNKDMHKLKYGVEAYAAANKLENN